jgi:hypothetical protein
MFRMWPAASKLRRGRVKLKLKPISIDAAPAKEEVFTIHFTKAHQLAASNKRTTDGLLETPHTGFIYKKKMFTHELVAS